MPRGADAVATTSSSEEQKVTGSCDFNQMKRILVVDDEKPIRVLQLPFMLNGLPDVVQLQLAGKPAG